MVEPNNQLQIDNNRMARLEQTRRDIRQTSLIQTGVSLLIGIICAFAIHYIVGIVVFIVARLIMYGFSSKKRNEFRDFFKKDFVEVALNNYFTDLQYRPYEGLDQSIIADTNMMNMGDRYSSEDYIDAKYKDVGFKQADVHIEEMYVYTDSNGVPHTSYVTIFRGPWLVFEFNKNFSANLQVVQKGFSNSKRKFSFDKNEKYKKVKMESDEFNKKFLVYAQSEHDAFYILTPHFMEMIINLSSNKKETLMFCFVDNKLHVAINNYVDSFELTKAYKKLSEEEIKENLTKDIKRITRFVDELKLDTHLFKS